MNNELVTRDTLLSEFDLPQIPTEREQNANGFDSELEKGWGLPQSSCNNPDNPSKDDKDNTADERQLEDDNSSNDSIRKESLDWTAHATQELEAKRNGPVLRNLRHRFMSVYRRLFLLIFIINLAVAMVFAARPDLGNQDQLAAACLGNLAASILIRHEHFVNTLFHTFASVPKSWPLWIRRHCAKIYSFGGIHSGCAFFGVVWLVWLVAKVTYDFVGEHKECSPATLGLIWTVVLLLILMVASAYPEIRARYHDYFEMTHRFAGWIVVILVWGLVFTLPRDVHHPKSGKELGHLVIHSAAFWFMIIITYCLIYPWFHLRKLQVHTEVLSSHVCRIHMHDRSYVTPHPGSFVRLSKDPLFEWHSFAAIADNPKGTGRKADYSVIVSKAGDWTSSIIAHPPTEIWQRSVPTCGVLYVAKIFRKIVLIGTGSGIGPCLAVLKAGCVDARVLWSTRAPRDTYGDQIVDDVLEADQDAVIYDTGRGGGRPDIVKMAYSLYKESGAEAVVIISNPKLTYQVVYGLEARGIPAYGAIWDS